MGGMDAAGLWVSLGASRRGERASRQAGRRGGVGGHGMAATHLRARLPGEDDRRGGGLGWLAGPGGDELGQKPGKSFSFYLSRSEEHTSELQSRGLISYAVF